MKSFSETEEAHVIYSFDVFDTCVSRRYAKPADIFFRLGLRLADEFSASSDNRVFARHFAKNRIRAERFANRLPHLRDSASIHEIYANALFPGLTHVDPAHLAEAEIDLERECIYPIPATKGHLDKLRREGHRIIFVSDMYLPANVLEPLLREIGILAEGDGLYVSCDVRLTKTSGKLFRYVLDKEGVRPNQVLHLGDSLRGDVEAPIRLGMHALRFTDALLTTDERRATGPGRVSRSPESSVVAALSRETRLHCGGEAQDSPALDRIRRGVIAPFLNAYVAWVIRSATEHGIKRLYFVARDGEVMHKIATRLLPASSDIELRYLYGSRRAWLHASIFPESEVWTKGLAPQGRVNTPRNILKRIGLDASEVAQIRDALDVTPGEMGRALGADENREFVSALRRTPGVHDRILASSSSARRVALRYFRQEGLLEDIPWAVVDTGWTLNCQASLKRILSSALGRDFRPVGYYIALMRNHLLEEDAGRAYSFVGYDNKVFCRRRHMIEHCFTPAMHATTQTYAEAGGKARAMLGEETRSQVELDYARRLHDISVVQAELIGREPLALGRLVAAEKAIVQMAVDLIARPSRQDAVALGALRATPDFFHEPGFAQDICRPLGIGDLAKLFRITYFSKSRSTTAPFLWLEGCCALSPPHINVPLAFLLWCNSTWTGLHR